MNVINGIGWAGWIPQNPRVNTLLTPDSLATITTAGYLSEDDPGIFPQKIYPTDLWDIEYDYDPETGTQTYARFTTSIDSNGVITLTETETIGNVNFPVTDGNFVMFQGTLGEIGDNNLSPSNAALPKVATMPSATYVVNNIMVANDASGGIRAGVGVQATQINSPQGPTVNAIAFTAGNQIGANATSGTCYGLEGFVSASGMGGMILSGINGLGTFGGTSAGNNQFSAVKATLSLGTLDIQSTDVVSPIISYVGSSGDQPTNQVSKISMFYGTNVLSAIIGQCLTLIGGANYLMNLNTNGAPNSYVSAATGTTPGSSNVNVKLNINGTDYYLLASNTAY